MRKTNQQFVSYLINVEDVKPIVVEDSSKQEVIGEGKVEDHRQKAA